MAVIETWFEQDLQKPVKVRYIDGNLFSHNGNGNRIGVVVTNNGEAVTLTGTVSGYAVLADGTTVPCTGSRSGNRASILVPAAAYSPGSILISIFLTDGTTVTTLAALSSSVIMTRTNNQVSPGSVVTDWTNTINAAMQSVETAAANLGNIVATPYANLTFPVPLGKYTIYNDTLYRCISPIATAESFTASHWVSTQLSAEIDDLNTALAHTEDVVGNRYYILHGCAMNSGGQIVASANFDTFCFKVTVGELLTVTGDFDGYAFYANEPQVGSVSYNSSATFTTSMVDVETPAGCSWAAVRCNTGNFLERNNKIDKLNEENANIEETLTQSMNRVGGDAATGVLHLPATWINGAFNTDGSFENVQQRATTRDWMKYTSSVTITCDGSYMMRVIGDGAYVSNWQTGDFTIPANTKYRINIRSNPDSTGTINPIEFGEKIHIKNPLNEVISPLKSQFDNLYSNFPFSNAELDKYIKELYTESNIDFSGVARVRVYNGFSGLYGARFFTSGDVQIADLTFDSYPNGVVCKNQLYAVIVSLSDIGAEWKDFSTTVSDCVQNVECMPTIYAFIKSKDINAIAVFSNTDLYKYIKELYFSNSSFDVSTIDRVRIFNGASNYYGAAFYNGSSLVASILLSAVPSDVAYKNNNDVYAVFANLSELGETYKDFSSTVSASTKNLELFPTIYAFIKSKIANEKIALITQPVPTKGQVIYEGDTKSNAGYIVNAVSYSDGVIIACRADGKVVRIGYTGTEETLLTISGTAPFDWRGCFMDSNENVYVSPHASLGSMSASDRGLYRLAKGSSSFTKVIPLYNSSSTTPTEAENNDDTIWTMCEDDSGNLYAGVYAHTVRANPAIYKSTDGGTTWTYIYNFKTAGDTPNGLHIHSIIWSKWQKALYVIVGEVNTVFRSADGGATWDNLNVTLTVKGSAMLATPYGVLIGSDGAYNCEIDLLENDNVTHVNAFKGWANTVFAIRRSDVTGMLYAFTKIDSSVNSTSYFPPVEALSDESVISAWHTEVGDSVYNSWLNYYNSVVDEYPDDAIRPQHYSILVSRDGGRNWEVLHAFSTSSQAASGCWTTGYFNNGECLTGRIVIGQAIKPVVISEGKHKYVSGGCNLDGEIFVRTNSSSTVTVVT